MFVFVLVYSCICACTCVHVLVCVNPECCVGVFSRLGDWSFLLEKAQYYANPGLLAFLSTLVHITHNHIQAQSTPISWASCSLDSRCYWIWCVCATALLKVAALRTSWLLFAPYGCPCIMCAPSCSHMAALCTMWLPMHDVRTQSQSRHIWLLFASLHCCVWANCCVITAINRPCTCDMWYVICAQMEHVLWLPNDSAT
jgi:hypothetical protein